MTFTVTRTIGSTGDFSTVQAWADGMPKVSPQRVWKLSAASFAVASFINGEAITYPGGGTGIFYDTDSTGPGTGSFICIYWNSAKPPSNINKVITGSTSGATCTLASASPIDAGAQCNGLCQNQEFVVAGAVLTLNDNSFGDIMPPDCYHTLSTVAGASFMDNAGAATNPLRYDATKGAALRCTTNTDVIFAYDSFRCSKLQLQCTGASNFTFALTEGRATSNQWSRLICESNGTSGNSSVAAPTAGTYRDCVFIKRGSGAAQIIFPNDPGPVGTPKFYQCTIVASDDLATAPANIFNGRGFFTGTCTVQNCGLFAGDSSKGIKTGTGTYNFTTCYSDISGTTGVTQATYGNEFVDVNDATRDFRLKLGAAQIGTATVDQINELNDIIGTPRPQGTGYDVGCWEYNVTLDQIHYRFRTDGGAVDANPTWGAAQDTTYQPGISNFRLRLGISNNASAVQGPSSYQIYVSKNGGAYAPITTSSSNVKAVDASSDPDGTIIKVPRLSAAP